MLQKHTTTDAIVAAIDQFTASTGVKVKIDILPQEQVVSKAQLVLSSGDNSYDVIMYDNMFTVQFAGANWIRDLGPYISATNYDVDDFMSGFVNAFTYNNKTYALPIYGESFMLMYNKELLARVGITKAPSNKAEFDQAVQKLSAAGIPAFSCRGARDLGGNLYLWPSFFLGMGGQWFTDGKLSVNTRYGVESVKYYADLLTKYSIPGGTNLTWDQVQLALQQNKVAMAVDATNFAPRLENPANSLVVGKIGYTEVPINLMVPSSSCWGLAIPTASKNPDAAWKFIQWVLGAEMQLSTAIDGDRCDVTRKSVMNNPQFLSKYNYDNGNWIRTTIAAMDKCSADYRPRITDWAKLGDSLAGAVSSVVSGQTTAEAALAQVDREVGSLTYPGYKK
jgi:multiple sugar transport system substrate-binding protein/sorbitol/mannitol transport system substrate-binding protein